MTYPAQINNDQETGLWVTDSNLTRKNVPNDEYDKINILNAKFTSSW